MRKSVSANSIGVRDAVKGRSRLRSSNCRPPSCTVKARIRTAGIGPGAAAGALCGVAGLSCARFSRPCRSMLAWMLGRSSRTSPRVQAQFGTELKDARTRSRSKPSSGRSSASRRLKSRSSSVSVNGLKSKPPIETLRPSSCCT